MNRWMALAIAGAALLAAAHLTACGDDETTRPPVPANDSPETALASLIESYRSRDIRLYAPLLHPDFRFHFQDGDEPPELGRAYWTAAEDSAATNALFTTDDVLDIRIDLTTHEAVPDTLERFPEELMSIRVTPMRLMVDDVHGTTYLIEGDIQDFYFVRGEGADSVSWYLYEWHDIDGYLPWSAREGAPSPAVEIGSWGTIKSQYWDGVIQESD